MESRIRLDKIASSTRNARIGREAVVSDTILAREGVVVAARVRGCKAHYNTLEDLHGRMIRLDDGDVIAGVLGSRRALRGYAGLVPERIEPGDRLHLLNLGGVIGRCTSEHLELGPPLEAEILGTVLSFPVLGERTGVPARIQDGAIEWAERLEPSAPVVYIAGTSMECGKTHAAGEIVRHLAKRGLRICGAKLTGVSLLRDRLSMEDRGAVRCLDFTDAGAVSTSETNAVPLAKGILNALNRERPDAVVVELGDGILGDYGVSNILEDDELMAAAGFVVLCANDPVGAWGGVELFEERFGRRVDVVSGPATDNAVGRDFVERRLGVAAVNARTDSRRLGELVEASLRPRQGAIRPAERSLP
jgi:hypothetical protein